MKQILFLLTLSLVAQFQFAKAEVQLPTAASLEGQYQGQDSLGNSCGVVFTKKSNGFSSIAFDVSITSSNETKVDFLNVKLSDIDRKIKEDTEWRKEQDKNFSDDNINFNLYRYKGRPSHFDQPSDSLRANWYKGTLSMVSIELENSYGPITDPNTRVSLTCFVLQKTK